MTLVGFELPQLFYPLPCQFNVQTNKGYKVDMHLHKVVICAFDFIFLITYNLSIINIAVSALYALDIWFNILLINVNDQIYSSIYSILFVTTIFCFLFRIQPRTKTRIIGGHLANPPPKSCIIMLKLQITTNKFLYMLLFYFNVTDTALNKF